MRPAAAIELMRKATRTRHWQLLEPAGVRLEKAQYRRIRRARRMGLRLPCGAGQFAWVAVSSRPALHDELFLHTPAGVSATSALASKYKRRVVVAARRSWAVGESAEPVRWALHFHQAGLPAGSRKTARLGCWNNRVGRLEGAIKDQAARAPRARIALSSRPLNVRASACGCAIGFNWPTRQPGRNFCSIPGRASAAVGRPACAGLAVSAVRVLIESDTAPA